jgi:hypothetical protein
MKTFKCSICEKEKPEQTNGGVGYGRTKEGNIVCYACAAELDKADMLKNGRATLYLSDTEITNWPGTLRIKIEYRKTGRHNIAGRRYDIWFSLEGQHWHGVQYGDNTQICHCKRIAS